MVSRLFTAPCECDGKISRFATDDQDLARELGGQNGRVYKRAPGLETGSLLLVTAVVLFKEQVCGVVNTASVPNSISHRHGPHRSSSPGCGSRPSSGRRRTCRPGRSRRCWPRLPRQRRPRPTLIPIDPIIPPPTLVPTLKPEPTKPIPIEPTFTRLPPTFKPGPTRPIPTKPTLTRPAPTLQPDPTESLIPIPTRTFLPEADEA